MGFLGWTVWADKHARDRELAGLFHWLLVRTDPLHNPPIFPCSLALIPSSPNALYLLLKHIFPLEHMVTDDERSLEHYPYRDLALQEYAPDQATYAYSQYILISRELEIKVERARKGCKMTSG